MFNVTPTYQGVPIDVSCGEDLVHRYGEFERFQTSDRWVGRDPVELQSDNAYFLVEATNSDDDPTHWSGDKYLFGGKRTFCVAYAHLNFYRCQDGQMSDRGALVGFGTNDHGYDLAK